MAHIYQVKTSKKINKYQDQDLNAANIVHKSICLPSTLHCFLKIILFFDRRATHLKYQILKVAKVLLKFIIMII